MKKIRLRTLSILLTLALIMGVVFCLPSCTPGEENTTESTVETGENTTESGSGGTETTETDTDGTETTETDTDGTDTTETDTGGTDTTETDTDGTDTTETDTDGTDTTETDTDGTDTTETDTDGTDTTETDTDGTDTTETDTDGTDTTETDTDGTDTTETESGSDETESGTDEESETIDPSQPHDCKYDNGVVTKQPTCKDTGTKLYTCTLCGETKEETLPVLTTHTYDSGVITKQPTCKNTGTKLYTCTVCGATKEETLKKTSNHVYDEGVVTKQATCKQTGTKLYTCTVCGVTKEETIPLSTQHIYDEGVVTKEPTYNETGIKLYTCSVCQSTKEEVIDRLDAEYTITIEGVGYYYVGPDGSYDIGTYEKAGYRFVEWRTSDGKTFASKGTINKNVTVTPITEILKTTTVEQLKELCAAGADKILIDADIVIDCPIYISGNTEIYSDKDVKLIRDPGYNGDMFVVGMVDIGDDGAHENDLPAIMLGKTAILTIGRGEGTLTIDGNRDNLNVTVVGSAIFVSDSATVNIYNNATIANHAKDGNDRAFISERYSGTWMAQRAGGAALLILNGNVNMYGGVITNNWARTTTTIRPNEEGVDTAYEDAACGGAIYNCGNFTMYGGEISSNEGYRGAAIYNDEIVRLYAGTISGNIASTYGGAISSSSAQEAQMFIGYEKAPATYNEQELGELGKINFINNKAATGGALYSNASSPIVILGNAYFEGNESKYGGGAIYTGGALTVRNTEFVGNKTESSGGAIYFWFNYKADNKPYAVRREMELTDCTFENNEANLGGAVILSASAEAIAKSSPQGAYADITRCTFTGNHATNGGALYITRYSDAYLNEVKFKENSSDSFGGAVSVQAGCTAEFKSVDFEGNYAANAGALYIYDTASTKFSDVHFINNQATTGNGGALYFNGVSVTLNSTVSFDGNSAANHGGAIYVSYVTVTDENGEQTRTGGTLNATKTVFENNTAFCGGAISARSESKVTLTNLTFTNCTSPNAQSGTEGGGGAIYANNSTVTLTTVKFVDCESGYYGGAIKFHTVIATLKDVEIKNAKGGTGAAVFASGGEFSATKLTVTNAEASVNGAIYLSNIQATFTNLKVADCMATNGAVMYASGATAVVTINTGTFTNNIATNGGAIYAVKATVNVKDSTFTDCVAKNGGAIFSDQATVTVAGNTSFNGNNNGEASATKADGTQKSVVATNGGALYMKGSTVIIKDTATFKNYKVSYQGGAIYSADYSYTVVTPADPEVEGSVETTETFTVPASLSITGAKFEDNFAGSEGGAVYLTRTTYDVSSTSFSNNRAEGGTSLRGGGAIYATASQGTLGENGQVTFIGNSSHKGGAVAIHSESTLHVYSMLAQGNYADMGTAINEQTQLEEQKFGFGGVFYVNSSHLYLEEGENTDDEIIIKDNYAVSGGAIYIEKNIVEPTLIISGAEFTNNASTYVQGDSYNSGYGGGAIWTKNTAVTITNSTFDGNESNYYGGAMLVINGSVTIDGGSIKNNKGGTGAALFLSGVTEATFNNVSVTDNVSSANGVIYCGNTKLTLQNLTATNNAAATGGVLYISGATSNVSVSGGTYQGNTATNGGAIWVKNAEKLSVSGATFTGNQATSEKAIEPNGGAIYAYTTVLEIIDSTFDSNQAKNHGGAIAIFGGTATLSGNNSFENNVAGNHGGAIHVMYYNDGTNKLGAKVEMTNGSFKGNQAIGGGAVSIRSNCVVTFNSTLFDGNTAIELNEGATLDGNSEGGGAIYVGYGTLNLNNVTMTNNSAQGQFGGAINTFYSTTTISGNTTIQNNSNGIFVAGGSANDLLVKGNLNVTGNTHSNVYLANGRKIKLVGALDDTASIGVTAAKDGEFVIADGENVTSALDYKNRFTADLAPMYEKDGKLLLGFIVAEYPLSSNGYKFEAIGSPSYQWYVLEGGEWVPVTGATNSTLSSALAISGKTYMCKATRRYGESSVEVTSTSVMYTTEYGPQSHAVCGDGCNHSATHERLEWYPISSIEELIAAGKTAGNYYLTSNLETSTSIVISENVNLCLNGFTLSAVANENSFSIITVKTGATLNLTDCTTDERTVYVKDGVIVPEGTEGADALALTGGIISGGHAAYGAAIYATGEVNAYNVNFVGNVASNRGGAIYFSAVGSEGTPAYSFNNVSFYYNYVSNSKYGGGAIYSTESHGTLNNVTLVGNHSFKGGAVALHSSSTLTVNGVWAEHNYAESGEYLDNEITKTGLGFGGVFYVNSSTLEIVGNDGDVNINNNSAEVGGAICVEWNNTAPSTVTITGAFLSGNTAGGNGGAVYFASGKGELAVTGSTLTGNSAQASGGAIYLSAANATLTVENTRFESNSADKNGGAILAAGVKKLEVEAGQSATSVIISGSDFVSNTSGYEGGAVYLSKCEDYSVSGGSFTSNTANLCVRGGGAIYSTGSNGAITNGTIFSDNHGTKGGAIALHSSSTLTVSSASFENNGAEVIDTCTCDPKATNKCVDGGHGWGGAIYANGSTLTLVEAEEGDRITFSYNEAVSGGAIHAESTSVTVSGATFDHNTATAAQTTYRGGGAIFISGKTLTVTDTDFTGNTSEFYGGAIAAKDGATVSVTGGNVENNGGDTGAAFWFYSCTKTTLDNVSFEGNVADEWSNGIIYINSGTENTFTNLIAQNNTANNGFIYTSGGKLTIEGGKFTGNTASGNGGVLYVCGSAHVTVNNATLGETGNGNSAANGKGGAIYVEGGKVTVEGGSFTDNSAADGGAVWVGLIRNTGKVEGTQTAKNTFKSVGAFSVGGATFTNNRAANGGAIYAYGAELAVSGGSFEHNVATNGHGGAIYATSAWYYETEGVEGSETQTISEVTVTDNAYFGYNQAIDDNTNDPNDKADNGYGGAIYVSHDGGVGSTLDITGGTFEYNSAENGGAIAGRTGTTITISGGATFSNNTAALNGGAIYNNSSTITITGGTLQNNASTYDVAGQNDYDNNKGGGAMFATSSTVTLNDVTLKGNSTGWYGGAMIAHNGSVTLVGCTVEDNTGATGAALNFNHTNVTIEDSSISNNTSSSNGVVYANGGTIKLENVAASGNVANKGGVLFLSGSAQATVKGGTYTSNCAKTAGGVVYMQNTSSLEITEGATLSFNGTKTVKSEKEGEPDTTLITADGGVIYVAGGTVTINGGTFEGNKANNGGAIYYTATGENIKLTVENTTFTSNAATNNGGAIYADSNTTVTVTGCTFTANTSKIYGGAIHVGSGSTLTVDSSTFDRNTALDGESGNDTKASGGAIYGTNATIIVSGDTTKFSNNQAERGGAIYLTSKATLEMSGGSFESNSAIEGGAVSIRSNCQATFNGTTLTQNSTSGDGYGGDSGVVAGGGAIYVGYGTLNLNGATITANSTATAVGGAVHSNNGTIKISGKIIINNNKVGEAQNNVYLNTTAITVVGELDADSKIGINHAKNGAVVKGGAELTVPVTDYLASKVFTHDYNVPMYAEDGVIKAGLLITQQPTRFNGYTFTTTCTDESHYQWYAWEGGAVKIEGATGSSLTAAFEKIGDTPVSGKVYVCYVTCGSSANASVESNRYYYCNEEAEKLVCGESCDHEPIHDELIKWLPISNAEELVEAGKRGGNYYLVQNISLEETVAVAADTNISLNGFNIGLAEGKSGFSFFNVPAGVTLTLTDWIGENSETRYAHIDEEGKCALTYNANAETGFQYKGSVIDGRGNTAEKGGAIYAEGNVVIYNVNFVNHTAKNGGAIYLANGAKLTVENSNFIANKATDTTSSSTVYNGGGAVYVNASKATFDNVSFFNNTTGYYGGAVVAYGAEVSITGGVIKNNSGTTGAALCFRQDNVSSTVAKYTVSDVEITYNKASGSGVVYMQEGTLTISNVDAMYNSSSNRGGFMYASGGTVNLMDSNIQSNSTTNIGSGIHINGATLNVSGKVVVSGNTRQISESESITENILLGDGKLYISGALTEGSDIGVTTSKDGAFITLAEGVEGIDIADYVSFFTSDAGKPVYAEDGKLHVGIKITQQPTTFNDYTVNSNGSTYKWYLSSDTARETVICSGSTLENALNGNTYVCRIYFGDNFVETGDVVYYSKQEHPVCGTSCDHSTAHESLVWRPISTAEELLAAGKVAGNYYLTGNIEVSESVVISANVNLCLNGKTLSAVAGDSKFSIITVGAEVTFNITDCGTDTTTVYVKDGVLVDSATEGATAVELKGGKITGGNATNGGAIYSTGTLGVYNVNFVGNTATGNGGAINVNSGAVAELYNCKFVGNNTANESDTSSGGAIYASRATVTISGDSTLFIANKAARGGAIYLTNQKVDNETVGSTLTMTGGKFEQNVAAEGGALSVRSSCTATLDGTCFTDNKATGDGDGEDATSVMEGGGAIYAGWSTLVLHDVTMTGNAADNAAGAIYANNEIFKISGLITINDNKVGEAQNNVYLNTTAITVVGELDANSVVGVTAGDGTIVKGDGQTVTDVSDYAANFFHDGGRPVYAESKNLHIGFAILQQPLNANSYTFVTSGAPTYQWYVLEGEEWVAVEGATSATLTGAEVGQTYKCKATLEGFDPFESNIVTYYVETEAHGHPICDASCTHGTHESLDWTPISSAAELITAGKVAGNYYLTGNIEVSESVVISANVNLCLNGYTLSSVAGEKEFSILSVSSGAALTLTDCGTETTTVYVKDGVLVDSATEGATAVELKGGKITGNHATQGSAIWAKGTVNIYGVNFVGNTIETYSTSAMGGAIYVSGGKLTVTDSMFVANTSKYQGGAIYVSGVGTTDAPYTITNTGFIGNGVSNSKYGGGAIYSTGSQGKLDNVTLIGNYSFKGGAIALHSSSTLSVSSLVAENNVANSGEYLDGETATTGLGIGGVFFVNNSTLTLAESGGDIVIDNNIAVSGGAIHAENGATVSVTGASFEGNSATNGGAIYASTSSSKTFSIESTTFTSNSATSNGGAIYVTGKGEGTVTGCTFTENSATSNGGAIDIVGTKLTLTGSNTFTSNTAGGHGGAIYVVYSGSGETQVGGQLYMTGGTFEKNSAAGGGAVSIRTKGYAEFTSTQFINNSASSTAQNGGGGGAIYIGYGQELKLASVTMTGNTVAGGYGGAVNSLNSDVNVTGGTFENNSARYGGAIYSTGNALSVNGATFKNNTASATATESDEAATNGGAISAKSTELTVTNCTFTGNSVSNDQTAKYNEHGGAIYADSATLTISGTTFTNNISDYYGGAIAAKSSEVSITGGSVSESKGITGAALWFNGCSKLVIDGTNVSNNSHSGSFEWGSGIIYVTGGTDNQFKNIVASQNAIVYNGGVFYISNSTATIEGGTFENNSAQYGGVIYIAGATSNVTLTNASLGTLDKGNSATASGGAIYVAAGTLNVNGGTFESNTAKNGGAIYAAGGTLNINRATFTSNSATTSTPSDRSGGGAICAITATVEIVATTFDSNDSGYYGGTIAAYDATLTIGNGSIIQNSEGATGSAICFKDYDGANSGNYTIDGLTLTGTVGKASGVIYINEGSLSINNLSATSNNSTSGGIIHASDTSTSKGIGAQVTITNSTIALSADYTAPYGAVNYTACRTLEITNLNVTGDENTEASIRVTAGTTTIYDATEPSYTINGSGTVTKPNISTQQ